jgi:UDP-2-acetamido-3-amino-2,3-dideoxy-glucuronate N-acetyltransferase
MAKVYFNHSASIVESKNIGKKTRIWAFVHILPKAEIGKECNICDHCFVENNVMIGNYVTIKSGVYLWDGIEIEDYVFIGPNVVFTNDERPRSKRNLKKYIETIIKKGVTLGANSTILPGIKIGQYAMVGAGSVVTKDISNNTLWYGNPAKFKAYICDCGNKLNEKLKCKSCGKLYKINKSGIMAKK